MEPTKIVDMVMKDQLADASDAVKALGGELRITYRLD